MTRPVIKLREGVTLAALRDLTTYPGVPLSAVSTVLRWMTSGMDLSGESTWHSGFESADQFADFYPPLDVTQPGRMGDIFVLYSRPLARYDHIGLVLFSEGPGHTHYRTIEVYGDRVVSKRRVYGPTATFLDYEGA